MKRHDVQPGELAVARIGRQLSGKQFVDILKRVEVSSSKNWEGKVTALVAFQEACQSMTGQSLDRKIAARAVSVLSDRIADAHNKVVSAGLDGLFYLLLCSDSPPLSDGANASRPQLTLSDGVSGSSVQSVLERKPEVLQRILARLVDTKEPIRTAAERVMHSLTALFRPEARVMLITRAVSSSFIVNKGRGTASVANSKMVIAACVHLVSAFESAEASGEGFVWQPVALLSSLLEAMAALLRDRREDVRKAAGPVILAAEHSLPEGAMQLALESLPLSAADSKSLQHVLSKS